MGRGSKVGAEVKTAKGDGVGGDNVEVGSAGVSIGEGPVIGIVSVKAGGEATGLDEQPARNTKKKPNRRILKIIFPAVF